MGYTTYFDGEFKLNEPLTTEHKAYLDAFSNTRRMRRNADLTAKRSDPVREVVKLPVGPEGAFFVGSSDFCGQERTPDILDYNEPPEGQPGLWCQWVPSEDGEAIVWNDGEKFYYYIEWIDYLVKNFLAPWGYILNGEVTWTGEDSEDFGKIIVKNNEVLVSQGRRSYEEPQPL